MNDVFTIEDWLGQEMLVDDDRMFGGASRSFSFFDSAPTVSFGQHHHNPHSHDEHHQHSEHPHHAQQQPLAPPLASFDETAGLDMAARHSDVRLFKREPSPDMFMGNDDGLTTPPAPTMMDTTDMDLLADQHPQTPELPASSSHQPHMLCTAHTFHHPAVAPEYCSAQDHNDNNANSHMSSSSSMATTAAPETTTQSHFPPPPAPTSSGHAEQRQQEDSSPPHQKVKSEEVAPAPQPSLVFTPVPTAPHIAPRQQQQQHQQHQQQQHSFPQQQQQQHQQQQQSSTRSSNSSSSGAPTYDVKRFEDLTDHQLATIDFKILMDLASRAGLSNDELAEVKAKRRRLKNRLSARICSNKKREKCSELEETNRKLSAQVKSLSSENSRLQNMNVVYAKDLDEYQQEVARLNHRIEHLTRLLLQQGISQSDLDVSHAA
ncbi:hypothetical protein PTSG_04825 [Salpingoeca rosetta]|uniref:BZIP domain-containing protein n=1 Tax=Salpingoeca rosetta (strain ATCC 50818 / BSB-021) TaxID=946362 RepID=F2U9T4_SALR5|nr:uncharacterized protein PTSG_04825 [Salpingoeca rosetta]EGD73111.1 hypothetical protein PTSG_04825 [Salpingoeca rosetta]|eukprot:XP_004994142.1 hypothetical protein PTSG_04825 [Salpingoeca rosetta]